MTARAILLAFALGAVWSVFWSELGRADGFRCAHTSQCAPHESCVADDDYSTWGRCRHLRVLP